MRPFPALLFLTLAFASAAGFMLVIACQFMQGGLCGPVLENYLYIGAGSIHLFLLSVSLFFLWRKDLRTTLRSVGLPGNILSHAAFTALGLTALFTMMFWLQLVSIFVGFSDHEAVREKVVELPLSVLVLAVVAAPITEELFFRGLLIRRIEAKLSSMRLSASSATLLAIFLSSAVFGILHFSYGSVVEIVGVFFIALILGAIFKISGSVAPCIAIHMIYNLISISVMKLVS